MRREFGFGPVRRPIFQIDDVANESPTKRGHDEIHLAVAVEIRRLNIRHSPQAVQQRDGSESSIRPATKPHDFTDFIIGRAEASQIGNDQVLDPVSVQVHDFGMAGVRQFRQDFPGRILFIGLEGQDLARAHIAHEQVQLLIVVEMDQVDVGRGREGVGGIGNVAALELDRQSAQRRLGRKPPQFLRPIFKVLNHFSRRRHCPQPTS